MDGEADQQKQDRHRTRWTASLDKIFADLVVEQIRQGNRPNNVFDKKTWNLIRSEFNSQTNLNFNNNQLRKHLDVLRTRYNNLRSAFDQHETVDDPCYIGFDLWEDIGAQPRPDTSKMKESPIYEQLCTIFGDSDAEGKYAQSSHYKVLEKSGGSDPSCLESENLCHKTRSAKQVQGNGSSQQDMAKSIVDRKRKRASETDSSPGQSSRAQDIGEAMAKALLDMVASFKLRPSARTQIDEKFPISYCIEVLDEIEGMDDSLYYAALDLFEDSNLREMFLSLKSNQIRLTWLQGKCPRSLSPTHSLGGLFALLQ